MFLSFFGFGFFKDFLLFLSKRLMQLSFFGGGDK